MKVDKMNKEEKFLFDTDTITNIFKKVPSEELVSKLQNLPKSSQFISTITISEIVYGAFKSSRPEFHLRNLKQILIPAANILPSDGTAAAISDEIRAKLEKKGTAITFADLLIAAIAVANNLTLVTGNTGHFINIDELVLENWLR